MSADSPRRGVHKGAQVIAPQPIVDRSILDSVAGIINDIVPQAYTGAPSSDNKETISWARFEYADINDPALYPDYNEGFNTPPLLLVLGYTSGVQIWLIAATGEATEILSWRQGVVRTLRILANPKTDDKHVDLFESKRPMIAICDSAGPGPQFCNLSFVSLKTGEQARSIKFKSPICDILANRKSIVVTFYEKIAIFDARTLEDVLSITTCYPSPGTNPNPVALGTRWLAYSEKKLLPARRSSGGCEGDGVQSYTATVLYAAKSLGKGLRGLGETVASSLTGNSVSPMTLNNSGSDISQPGVVTILDLQAAKEEKELDDANIETVIAHFTAHSDAIVAMTFDLTGALLMTADKRGHDFHIFRIHPHPGGPTLAAVHHLYVLHRGDTTAKVQDMVFSSDARWAAVSTIRGTTHVFPVAPYGGPVGVRTHSTPHVVNRHSRFHRSAGLTEDGARSHSPVTHSECAPVAYPYSNPRLPPYPHPTIINPLAQIRQPSSLNHVHNQSQSSRPQQRQRLHSDDSSTSSLKLCACFAPPRAWIYAQREPANKVAKRPVDSLFIMAGHGNMIQYDLEPKPVSGVPKEKVCDETSIELDVEVKGQWPLLRTANASDIAPPLPSNSPLLNVIAVPKNVREPAVEAAEQAEDRWLSQVEIVTHTGPHRRLWMGPQFVFKTYIIPSGGPVSNLVEMDTTEVGTTGGSRPARSNPVNMPHATTRPLVPVVIDGSGSSYEQSPRFMEAYGDPLDNDNMAVGSGENQLREDLAEAMLETSIAPHRAPGRRSVFERVGQPVTKVVNPLGTVITVSADDDDVTSSQEFDSAEESVVPEAPRSICAEEGPASLGDFEPESQTLRDLTEICAEMRSASEPAIDSVPDDSIREVRERKALCVEMASASGARPSSTCTIDFEREGAFQDVPTGLSLCAEQGEIPSSQMAQTNEQAWCGRSAKHEEQRMAKAKYVVNYDEDSVVLMENNTTNETAREASSPRCADVQTSTARRDQERENNTNRTSRSSSSNDSRHKKIVSESKTKTDRYVVREESDSVVIESTSRGRNSSGKNGPKTSPICEGNQKIEILQEELDKITLLEELKANTNDRSVEDSETQVADEESNSSHGTLDSFVILSPEKSNKTNDKNNETSTDTNCELPPLEPPPLEDFSNAEYHIVEGISPCKDASSDEDIVHVYKYDVPLSQKVESGKNKRDKDNDSSEVSSTSAKNVSKSQDKGKEIIKVSDVAEFFEKVNMATTLLEASCAKPSTLNPKSVISSDDDLEHIHHSDIDEALSKMLSIDSKETEPIASKEPETEEEERLKIKATKQKDVVTIKITGKNYGMTTKSTPVDTCNKSKLPDNNLAEEGKQNLRTSGSSSGIEKEVSPGTNRKTKAKTSKALLPFPTTKYPQTDGIEIINIDAMQKAEMETESASTSTPECKILSPRHESSAVRSKKVRKSRKTQSEGTSQDTSGEAASTMLKCSKVKMAELKEAAEDHLVDSTWQEPKSPPTTESSWSSIVKKKSPPLSDSELGKEPDNDQPVVTEENIVREEEAPMNVVDSNVTNESPNPPEEVQKQFEANTDDVKLANSEDNIAVVVDETMPNEVVKTSPDSTDEKKSAESKKSSPKQTSSKQAEGVKSKIVDTNKKSPQAENVADAVEELPSTIEKAPSSANESASGKESDTESKKNVDAAQDTGLETSRMADDTSAPTVEVDEEPPQENVDRSTHNAGTTSSRCNAMRKTAGKKKKKRRS